MKIHVLYFQNVRKLTGCGDESLDLETGATLDTLTQELIRRHPALASSLPSLLFAVNEEHATRNDVLHPDDRVAVMPPFSGG